MKIYIIEECVDSCAWELYNRIAYKNKAEAKKVLEELSKDKKKTYLISELRLR